MDVSLGRYATCSPGQRANAGGPAVEPHAVVEGDCLAGLAKVETGTVALVSADPPFNIGYEYDAYDDRQSEDAYLGWTRHWGQEVRRVLKPSGTFWLAIGDEYAAELK